LEIKTWMAGTKPGHDEARALTGYGIS